MFLSNLVSGLLVGLPLMLAVGPIAILLLDQGLERGARAALPAAFGVASADLTFSVLAAIGGTSVAVFLRPVTGWLSLAAVALLLVLAVRLFRTAFAELRAVRALPAASAPSLVGDMGDLCLVGTGDPMATSASLAERGQHDLAGGAVDSFDSSDSSQGTATAVASHDAPGIPFGHFRGVRLGAAFYGLTVVNPLTVVLFAAVVVAGGSGAGTPGWAIGMALASLLVHGGWVLVGGALGATIGPVATARMRLAASLLMAGLAVHFLLA